jgi:rod shape-determining protein MreC
MDHQPPPFFKRGPAPLARLTFYAALSLALIFVDSRFQTLELLQARLVIVHAPHTTGCTCSCSKHSRMSGSYFSAISRFQDENARLKRAQLDVAETRLRTQHLEVENERLRKLLDVKSRLKANGRVTQILYAARDPFSRRVIVDKGQQDNIVRRATGRR